MGFKFTGIKSLTSLLKEPDEQLPKQDVTSISESVSILTEASSYTLTSWERKRRISSIDDPPAKN